MPGRPIPLGSSSFAAQHRNMRARPERRIVVVGHSAFFRHLLLPEAARLGNCAVWRATLTAAGEPAWRGAVELFPGWESFSDGEEDDAEPTAARETASETAHDVTQSRPP